MLFGNWRRLLYDFTIHISKDISVGEHIHVHVHWSIVSFIQ